MQHRRSDNVFLLTLVDFLVQIIFFGLFIFVVYQALLNREAKQYNPGDVNEAIERAGVSNLKELIDELSKLAPIRLKGFNDALGDSLPEGDELPVAVEAAELGEEIAEDRRRMGATRIRVRRPGMPIEGLG